MRPYDRSLALSDAPTESITVQLDHTAPSGVPSPRLPEPPTESMSSVSAGRAGAVISM